MTRSEFTKKTFIEPQNSKLKASGNLKNSFKYPSKEGKEAKYILG
jgi:hypothetical protein